MAEVASVPAASASQADLGSSDNSTETGLSMQSLDKALPKTPESAEEEGADEIQANGDAVVEENGDSADAEAEAGVGDNEEDPISRALRDYSVNLAKYTASRFEDTESMEGENGKKQNGVKESASGDTTPK